MPQLPIRVHHGQDRLYVSVADMIGQMRSDAADLRKRAQQYASAGVRQLAHDDLVRAEQLSGMADHLDLALIEHAGCPDTGCKVTN